MIMKFNMKGAGIGLILGFLLVVVLKSALEPSCSIYVFLIIPILDSANCSNFLIWQILPILGFLIGGFAFPKLNEGEKG